MTHPILFWAAVTITSLTVVVVASLFLLDVLTLRAEPLGGDWYRVKSKLRRPIRIKWMAPQFRRVTWSDGVTTYEGPQMCDVCVDETGVEHLHHPHGGSWVALVVARAARRELMRNSLRDL